MTANGQYAMRELAMLTAFGECTLLEHIILIRPKDEVVNKMFSDIEMKYSRLQGDWIKITLGPTTPKNRLLVFACTCTDDIVALPDDEIGDGISFKLGLGDLDGSRIQIQIRRRD
jgi:hypothetical protein